MILLIIDLLQKFDYRIDETITTPNKYINKLSLF